jgi:hypothetical protein
MELPKPVEIGICWSCGQRYAGGVCPNCAEKVQLPADLKPKFVPPFCGGKSPDAPYDIDDCNFTNRVYELALSFARSRGEQLPSAEDQKIALEKIIKSKSS